MLTNEYKVGFAEAMINYKLKFWNGNNTIMIFNLIATAGFLLKPLFHYNIAFNLGYSGDCSKLKQLSIIFGVPIFLLTFIIPYLDGMSSVIDVKTVFELLLILFCLHEINDIESEHLTNLYLKNTQEKLNLIC